MSYYIIIIKIFYSLYYIMEDPPSNRPNEDLWGNNLKDQSSNRPNILKTVMDEDLWKNNGLLGDIKNTEYIEDYYNNVDYDNSPNTDTLKNCNTQEQLKGILDETLLSNTFFSVDNIQNIQNMIRYYFFQEKNEIISEQSNNELLIIMRGIYIKYSNSAANTIDEIKSEVLELNNIVIEFSLKQIYINYDNWNKHIEDLEKLPEPIDLPKAPERNNYTYDTTNI